MEAATGNFGEDIADVVKSQLECPVCFNSCTATIFMCANGHNVCSTCQPNLESCPVCRLTGQPIIRNLFAEELSRNAWVPCKNIEQGCGILLKIKEISSHLQVCDFGYKCMFEDCKWRGSVTSLSDHAQNVHRDYFFMVGDSGVNVLNTGELDAMISMLQGQHIDGLNEQFENCQRPIQSTAILSFKQNIFWYLTELLNGSFKLQIRLIDSAEIVPTQSYQLECQTQNGSRILWYKNKVRSLMTECYSDNIFNNYFEMNPFAQSDSLTFVLKMFEGPNETAASSTIPSGFPQARHSLLQNWQDLTFRDLQGECDETKIIAEAIAGQKIYQAVEQATNHEPLDDGNDADGYSYQDGYSHN